MDYALKSAKDLLEKERTGGNVYLIQVLQTLAAMEQELKNVENRIFHRLDSHGNAIDGLKDRAASLSARLDKLEATARESWKQETR